MAQEDVPVDVDRALLDPTAVFSSPEEVAEHGSLSLEQKVEILRRWEYDAAELAVATEEGMPGGENHLLRRVLLTLSRLTGGLDVEHTGPTKQDGLPRQ